MATAHFALLPIACAVGRRVTTFLNLTGSRPRTAMICRRRHVRRRHWHRRRRRGRGWAVDNAFWAVRCMIAGVSTCPTASTITSAVATTALISTITMGSALRTVEHARCLLAPRSQRCLARVMAACEPTTTITSAVTAVTSIWSIPMGFALITRNLSRWRRRRRWGRRRRWSWRLGKIFIHVAT